MRNRTIYTIGHSTRPIEEFIDLLKQNGVDTLVDIRTVPGSRKNPQFGQEQLRGAIVEAGLEYIHAKDLGGLRKTRKDSRNGGWRNESFRGYADYMQTEQFHNALDWLMKLAQRKHVAIMCAEAVPWRCHRNLVSDALLVHGFKVKHIIGEQKPQEHKLCAFAQVEGEQIIYA